MDKPSVKANLEELNEAGRKFSDTTILLHQQIAQSAGLAGTDHKYLGILLQHGEMTAGELAQFSGLTTGAVTGLIDRLEKAKLVKRKRDKIDRRKVVIEPDQKQAFKLLGTAFTTLLTKLNALYANYTAEEQAIVLRYLKESEKCMSETIELLKNK